MVSAMRMYRTMTSISHNSGEILLTKQQADARRHLLISTQAENVFLPKGELTLKAGEVIGLPNVSKSLAECLAPIQQDQKKGK